MTGVQTCALPISKRGKRVLLIDADAQGSLTASLGFREPDHLDITFATILANVINDGVVSETQ